MVGHGESLAGDQRPARRGFFKEEVRCSRLFHCAFELRKIGLKVGAPLAGDLKPRPLKHAEVARERGSYLDPASFQFERGVEL